MVDVTDKDKARISLVLGDRSADGKIDLTVTVEGRVPVIGWLPKITFTKNIPIKEAISVAQAACAVLPPPAREVASVCFGVLKGIVVGLES